MAINPIGEMFKLKSVKDDYRLNAVLIPALRTFGFSLLVVYVFLYEEFILDVFSWQLYGLLVGYLAYVEHRPIDWKIEILKMVFLYGMNIYLCLTARPNVILRQRTHEAIRVARQLNQKLKRRTNQLQDAKSRAELANKT